MDPQDAREVFQRLRDLLSPHASVLTVKVDQPGEYWLDGLYSPEYRKDLYFGSVAIKKNYVSYYLMPVYMNPALLDSISPALKKHMQGKSCFNFKRVEPELFEELGALTRRGVEAYQARGWAR